METYILTPYASRAEVVILNDSYKHLHVPITHLAIVNVQRVPAAWYLFEFFGCETIACLFFIQCLKLGNSISEILCLLQLIVTNSCANATP